jgi:hypothetical protein
VEEESAQEVQGIQAQVTNPPAWAMEMKMSVSIKGLDKAEILAALYNEARPLGLGMLHFDPEPMTVDEAREMIGKYLNFDYVKGRPLKVSLDGDELDTRLYDRDQGQGKGERIVNALRAKAPQFVPSANRDIRG